MLIAMLARSACVIRDVIFVTYDERGTAWQASKTRAPGS